MLIDEFRVQLPQFVLDPPGRCRTNVRSRRPVGVLRACAADFVGEKRVQGVRPTTSARLAQILKSLTRRRADGCRNRQKASGRSGTDDGE